MAAAADPRDASLDEFLADKADFAAFLAENPDFELRSNSEGKPEVFVQSIQKILLASLPNVMGFYP